MLRSSAEGSSWLCGPVFRRSSLRLLTPEQQRMVEYQTGFPGKRKVHGVIIAKHGEGTSAKEFRQCASL